ncbi:MAG: hypothetical protein KDJ82_13105, partial [Rhodobacteraceae bacterium]|nr:hypothetical protein [Paracoccaceae bacterium]
MVHWKLRGAGVLVASLLGSTAVWADVTPEEVWTSWSNSYQAFGYDVTVGSQDRAGDTLTLNDVVMTAETPDAISSMKIEALYLRDLGDGTVEVTTSETSDLETTAKAEDEEIHMVMQMRQKDMKAIVSGTPDNLAYDMTAPEIVIDMDQVVSNGETQPVKMQMTLL